MLQDDAATLDEIKRMSGERLQVLLALPCCRPCWRVTAMWVVLMALARLRLFDLDFRQIRLLSLSNCLK